MTNKPGDWVRFHAVGGLRIGQVEYARPMNRYPWRQELVTDAGIVEADAVLESRPAMLTTPTPSSHE